MIALSPQRNTSLPAIMGLLYLARTHGHGPCAYLKDLLERLPTILQAASTNGCRTAARLWPENHHPQTQRVNEVAPAWR